MKTVNIWLKPVKIDLTNAHSWRKVWVLEPASSAIVRWMDGNQLLAIRTPESISVLSVFI
jgi:hypothetical protein